MTDPISLAQSLQSAKAALDIAKGLLSIQGAYKEADLKAKISELADYLFQARLGLLEASAEIQALKTRIQELERAQDIRGKVIIEEGVYWLPNEKGRKGKDGPYCIRCLDVDNKLLRLKTNPHPAFGMWKCPECKNSYA